MKILINGSKAYSGLEMSFLRAFQKLGHEAELFPDEGLYRQSFRFVRNRYTHRLFWKLFSLPLQKEFEKTVEENKPDLILVLKGWFFSPQTLKKIRKYNPDTKLFCFNQENPFNIKILSYSNKWILKSIPLFDVYFTWGKFLIEPLKKAGAKKVEYLPFAYDSDLHYPIEVKEEERKIYGSDIAFIGTWSKDREYWLNHILNYDLNIWGNSWEKAKNNLREKWKKKCVTGEEFSKVCSSSKIIIDILRPQMFPAHSMKTFEIPGCRGFLLCNRGKEIHNFFEETKEIVTFNTPEEMIEKIEFYLKKEDLRKRISQMGYEKVVKSNNTYAARAKRIIEVYEDIRKK